MSEPPTNSPVASQARRGPILDYLAADHRRLESLLHRAAGDPDRIDRDAYATFRSGLLRHIGMEEKILLPAVHRVNEGEKLPQETRIRLDHGAIAALLVLPPVPRVIRTLRRILALHDLLEEGPGGVYELCDKIAGREAIEIVERLREMPEPPVARAVDNPNVMAATERALERAGYRFDDEPN